MEFLPYRDFKAGRQIWAEVEECGVSEVESAARSRYLWNEAETEGTACPVGRPMERR